MKLNVSYLSTSLKNDNFFYIVWYFLIQVITQIIMNV